MSKGIFILAAGGIGPHGNPIAAFRAPSKHQTDATPVDLRTLAALPSEPFPRLASRFGALAVAGARQCIRQLGTPLAAGTAVYLATGLGDVARTDALYYQVMPPHGEMASPAQFATSGNNMAAFFVAQQLGFASRNFTVSQDDLSFEHALQLAIDELSDGTVPAVLVGGVDETTMPREFYVRRYPPGAHKFIGEGSAWMALSKTSFGAIGEVLQVVLTGAADRNEPRAWAIRIAAAISTVVETQCNLIFMPGTRLSPRHVAALKQVLPVSKIIDYRDVTGCFPTAAASAVVNSLAGDAQSACCFLHVSCDMRGRTAATAWHSYMRVAEPKSNSFNAMAH